MLKVIHQVEVDSLLEAEEEALSVLVEVEEALDKSLFKSKQLNYIKIFIE